MTTSRGRARVDARHHCAHPTAGVRAQPSAALQLQSAVGNRRVTLLLSKLPVQRTAATGAAFDPQDVRNKLIRAIDTTPIALPLSGMYLPREVNVSAVVDALEGLTAGQVAEVKRFYLAHEERQLEYDLFSSDRGGTNLSQANRARIGALLQGTLSDASGGRAASSAAEFLTSAGAPPALVGAASGFLHQAAVRADEAAADARSRADAAELRQLLTDDPNERERERIMALLRHDPAHNGRVAQRYRELFESDLYADLRKNLKEQDAVRAERLVVGDRVGADAAAVEQRQRKIAELDREMNKLSERIEQAKRYPMLGASAGFAAIARKKLEDQRIEQVRALQSILESTRQEAAAEANPASRAAAAADRVKAVLSQPTAGGAGSLGQALSSTLQSPEQAVVAAMAAGSTPELAASRLWQAALDGKLTAATVEAELRGLREQAARDASAEMLATLAAAGTQLSVEERLAAGQQMQGALPAATERRASAYFAQLRDSYAAKDLFRGAFGHTFDKMVQSVDSAGGTTKIAALFQGHGTISDVDELVIALQGDHKDIETVKRVLAGKGRKEFGALEEAYAQRTNRSQNRSALREDLLGRELNAADTSHRNFSELLSVVRGKASGHDAFLIREMLDQPEVTGGIEEATYLATQADKEREWAIDDSGWFSGTLHDLGGSETRSLMEETARSALKNLKLYEANLAAGRPDQAQAILEQIRRDRARMRGDRAAYSDSVEQFRAKLAAALSMAVDIAVLVFVPAAAPFLTTLGVTVAGHVAVNLAVYGDKYTADMLKHDVIGAIGAAAGSKLAELALAGKVAGGAAQATERLGEDLALTASKSIAREVPELASESVLTMAKRQAVGLGKEAVENVAGSIGEGVATGDVQISAGEIAKGMLVTRAGLAGRKLVGRGHGSRVLGTDDTAGATAPRPEAPSEPAPAAGPRERTQPPAALPEAMLLPGTLPGTTPLHEALRNAMLLPGALSGPTPLSEAMRAMLRIPGAGHETAPVGPARPEASPADAAPEVNHPAETKPEHITGKESIRGAPTDHPDDQRTPTETDSGPTKVTEFDDGPTAVTEFDDVPTVVEQAPRGIAQQAADPSDLMAAWRLFDLARSRDSGREVGIMWNRTLDQYAVVQGDRASTDFKRASRELGWTREDSIALLHVHPPGRGGHTPDVNLLPSGRGRDTSAIKQDTARRGPDEARAWEAILVTMPGGRPDRTWLFYDREAHQWTVDFPSPGAHRGRERISFTSETEYHDWFEKRFGISPGDPLPTDPTRAAPSDPPGSYDNPFNQVTITGGRLSSAGDAGSGVGAEHGVYPASSAAHPGEDLVVKSYPRIPDRRGTMETELTVAKIAEQAGLDVRAIGFVEMPKIAPDGTPIDAVGIGMRRAQGGFFEEGFATSQQVAQELASNAANINAKTRADIATFRDALTAAGWCALGDIQGFVAHDGTWTPIDFQSYEYALSTKTPAEIKATNDAEFASYLKEVNDSHAAALSGSFDGYPVNVTVPTP